MTRAAVVSELGRAPALEDVPDPEPGAGEALLDVLAVPLNPIDLSVGSGVFYGGHPDVPYIAGVEAVGRVVASARFEPGTIVWAHGGGLGIRRDGLLRERAAVPDDVLVPVPERIDPPLAGALGVAGLAGWIPVAWRARVQAGDRVLVLGATGAVGLVAVQAARVLGAARVVAAGRNREALERAAAAGADAVVDLSEGGDLAAAFREALGDGATVVVDPLWGTPLVAALDAAAPGARIVNIGQSAGAEATIPSRFVRGKQIELFGYSNLALPREVLEREYRALVAHAAEGKVRLDVETVPLERVVAAWERQRAGAGRKLVVCP